MCVFVSMYICVCVLALHTVPLPFRVSHSLVKWLFEWFFNEVLSGGENSQAAQSPCAVCVCVCAT